MVAEGANIAGAAAVILANALRTTRSTTWLTASYGRGSGVIRGLGSGVILGEGLGLGVGVGVGVGGGVGVPPIGFWIVTAAAPPVLKKPTYAFGIVSGGACASNRKLYNVPQRIAFAFWFCTMDSQLH